MRSRLIGLIALLIALGSMTMISQCEAGAHPLWWVFGRQRTLVDEYDLLNSQLIKRVSTESPRENLDEAADMLAEVQSGKKQALGVDLPSEEALVLFIELNNLLDPVEPHCDMFAHDILLKNARATNSQILRPLDDQRPLRRVDMVVYQAAYEHAEHCLLEYPKKFASYRIERERRPLSDVRDIMQALIETVELFVYGSHHMDKRHLSAMKARSVSLTGNSEARALLHYLRTRVRDKQQLDDLKVGSHPHKRGYWAVNSDRVRAIMSNLIFSRCEHLFHRFEAIFEPAMLEQKLYPERQRYRPSSDNISNFMIWLEYYRLCKEMTSSRNKVEGAVLKAIWAELEPAD